MSRPGKYLEDAGTRTRDVSTKHAWASALTICATSPLTRARTRTLYRRPVLAGLLAYTSFYFLVYLLAALCSSKPRNDEHSYGVAAVYKCLHINPFAIDNLVNRTWLISISPEISVKAEICKNYGFFLHCRQKNNRQEISLSILIMILNYQIRILLSIPIYFENHDQ